MGYTLGVLGAYLCSAAFGWEEVWRGGDWSLSLSLPVALVLSGTVGCHLPVERMVGDEAAVLAFSCSGLRLVMDWP